MRLMSKVLLAGLGCAALAGTAVAADNAVHVLNVAMPDGGVARIHYIGDTAPQVRFVPVAMPVVPVAMIDPSFAAIDRMMAAMDTQADAMMRQAAMLQQMPTTPMQHADLQKLPGGGTISYSYVSTTTANGCTQTVRMTSDGGSADQPKVIRTSAGQYDQASMQPAVSDARAAPAKPVPAVATKTKTADPVDPNAI